MFLSGAGLVSCAGSGVSVGFAPGVCQFDRGTFHHEGVRVPSGAITTTGGGHMGRSSRWPYVRKQAWDRDRKARAVCHICGQPIDYSVRPSSEPWAWEPDHVLPVSQHPELELDLNNIKASHMECNRARSDNKFASVDLGMQSRIW